MIPGFNAEKSLYNGSIFSNEDIFHANRVNKITLQFKRPAVQRCILTHFQNFCPPEYCYGGLGPIINGNETKYCCSCARPDIA
jgi:hypothetical protein